MSRSVGIDLGTTKSVVATLDRGRPRIVPNSEGALTTPSVVAFADSGTVLTGQIAKDQALTNIGRTFKSVKRHMGTLWTTPEIDGRAFIPQEIEARLLQKLKRDAEAYLGEEVTDAVITVPAYFGDIQRQATKEAAEIAGLNVLRIIHEPTAAAIAYGLDKGEKEQTILVFDLGGGTFDVSLLDIGEGVVEVKATNGDNHLGGDDWDERLRGWLVDAFRTSTGLDLTSDAVAMERLREAAEQAKTELSSRSTVTVTVPYLARGGNNELLSLDEILTRVEFERITADLLDRTRARFNHVIKDAGISVGDIDHVLLVGGSTRMPAVTELVRELTGGKEPNKGVNPDEVVAAGAALNAGVLRGEVKDVLLLDVTPLSIGIEGTGGVMTRLIERNTTIPTKRSEVFTTTTRDDPSEGLKLVLALPTPTPENDEPKDAAPFTSDDTSESVRISVYQGEQETAVENTKLGELELSGLPAAPPGVLRIKVSFDVDANGIVHVSAKDLGTGRAQTMRVTGRSALDADELDRLKREASQFAAENMRRREEDDEREQAELLLRQTVRLLRQQELPVPLEAVTDVWEGVGAVRAALAHFDTAAVRQTVEILGEATQRLGAALYAAGDPTAAADALRRPHARRGRDPSGGIFISYRRDDTGPMAGRLRDRLEGQFGERRVFIDVDDIGVGIDYRRAISDALDQSSVLLALIGKDWCGTRGEDGRTRIEREDDDLRREIELALDLGLFVVPVLVEQAAMPAHYNVPPTLREFVTFNATPLGHRTFRRDLGELVDVLRRALGLPEPD